MTSRSHIKIIAEIGENFIGDIDIARQLISEAAASGADYVKFQSYTPETFKADDPEYDWFKKVSLSDDMHKQLMRHAETKGIMFLSSPFSLERARFLCEGLGLKQIKIASGVMLNFDLLDYLNSTADIVFLSTGMATIAQIKEALSHLDKVKECYILHCVTQYPCKDEEANLMAISALQKEFPGYEIGYSDHTQGIDAAVAAAALGAKVIEKHFTFNKQAKEGTDHILSVTAEELADMVKSIRRIEKMLGDSVKMPTESEKAITEFVRNRFIQP